MKRKSDPPKARAGLIKSFELKRRKQSENSNRVPAKSLGDGTAVAAGAPANAAELPPACSPAPGGPNTHFYGSVRQGDLDLTHFRAGSTLSTSSVIDAR